VAGVVPPGLRTGGARPGALTPSFLLVVARMSLGFSGGWAADTLAQR